MLQLVSSHNKLPISCYNLSAVTKHHVGICQQSQNIMLESVSSHRTSCWNLSAVTEHHVGICQQSQNIMLESVSSHNKLQTSHCDLSVITCNYQYQAARCQQSQKITNITLKFVSGHNLIKLQLVSSRNTPYCSLSVVTMNYKHHAITSQ